MPKVEIGAATWLASHLPVSGNPTLHIRVQILRFAKYASKQWCKGSILCFTYNLQSLVQKFGSSIRRNTGTVYARAASQARLHPDR